eukprot:7942867-Karenia_brevis.AAC.1
MAGGGYSRSFRAKRYEAAKEFVLKFGTWGSVWALCATKSYDHMVRAHVAREPANWLIRMND